MNAVISQLDLDLPAPWAGSTEIQSVQEMAWVSLPLKKNITQSSIIGQWPWKGTIFWLLFLGSLLLSACGKEPVEQLKPTFDPSSVLTVDKDGRRINVHRTFYVRGVVTAPGDTLWARGPDGRPDHRYWDVNICSAQLCKRYGYGINPTEVSTIFYDMDEASDPTTDINFEFRGWPYTLNAESHAFPNWQADVYSWATLLLTTNPDPTNVDAAGQPVQGNDFGVTL